MKILFWGGRKGNNGPTNVSNSYRKALTENFVLVKSEHKYGQMLEAVWKLLRCDCVVVSGISKKGALLIGFARIFGKKSVYIMHGCGEYEHKINGTKGSWQAREQEKYLLKHCTLLLPVSQKYMYWVRERYPHFAYKTKYLHNGIDTDLLPKNVVTNKIPNSVIAAGGSCRLKCNHVLADVVEKLEGKVSLDIYGGKDRNARNGRFVRYVGQVSNEQFHRQLAQSCLFVLNSIIESFSVATIEALMCGCSILVSEVAGVTDLLTLEETDVIHDPMDKEEIRRKIEYLLENPNNERICSKLDLEEYSYPKQVEKMERLCRELIEK